MTEDTPRGAPVAHPPPPTIAAGPVAALTLPDDVPDEDFPAIKSAALAAAGSDEVRVIPVDGIAHPFVMRRPTKAEWDDYFNAANQREKAFAGNRMLAIQCCLWPDRRQHRGRFVADEEVLPALATRLCDALELWCGYAGRSTVDCVLSAKTITDTPDVLDAAGVPDDVARRLTAQYHHPGQLWLVRIPTTPDDWPAEDQVGVTLVCKTPPRATYEAMAPRFAGTEKAAASYDLAMSCVVWPPTASLPELFAAAPGIPGRIADKLLVMGGAIARTSAKKR